MSQERSNIIVSRHEIGRGSLKAYVVGFLASLYLTVMAYLLAVHHAFSMTSLVAAIIGLALLQFVVQLLFFLHIGAEAKPRWKLLVFWLMIVVVSIIVFGSLWIMSNLNYHMTQSQINSYLKSQDGL